ncbi:MAG: MBL fold metallo-hydrolase [Reichenbachiella sp.]
MKDIKTLDLHFKGLEHAIASFLIESSEGPILIETGPHSTFEHLQSGLNAHGYQIEDVKHVLLTHIHLDHAGAAWAFADHGAKIYVHPFGARNIADPSRLMASARQIYQDEMDSLWGAMNPINEGQLVQVEHQQEIVIGDIKLISHHTPGHAKHHIAWQLDKTLFTGDVAGVMIENGPVQPPCPPPDINIELWKASILLIKTLDIDTLQLTHYGAVKDINLHLNALEKSLDSWSQFVYEKWSTGKANEEIIPLFMEFTAQELKAAGLRKEQIDQYQAANPAWMSVAGLVRYWSKKSQPQHDQKL